MKRLSCLLGFHRWRLRTTIWLEQGPIRAFFCTRCDAPLDKSSKAHLGGDFMTADQDGRTPDQHRRWNEFMEHVATPPQAMGENAAGDLVIEWPRVRFTLHIKPCSA